METETRKSYEESHGSGFLQMRKQWESLAQNHNVEGMSSYSFSLELELFSSKVALVKMLLKMGEGRLGDGNNL